MESSDDKFATKNGTASTKVRMVAIAALVCALAATALSLSLNVESLQGARPPLIYSWLAGFIVLAVLTAFISSSAGLIVTRFRGTGFYLLLALAVAFAVRLVLDP